MDKEKSLWLRIKRKFRPEPENYETRVARPADGREPGQQYGYGVTDQRRDGGSFAAGP
ncbi:hypothetical protein GCM10017690_21190 [Microbacterium terregens]